MALQAVIFDFDYTLADSSAGIVDCIRTSQAQMGMPPSAPEEIYPTIGLSVPDILATLNGEDQRPRAEEFARRFQARADEVMADNTAFYDGVPGVLEEIAGRGLRSAIASTKFRYRIEEILRRDDLADLVAVVIGAEDVSAHKPDPACLQAVLGQLDVPPGDAVYVGDSLPDAGAAQRAGIDFVAVLTGTTTTEQFAPFHPVAVLDSVTDLSDWLTTRMAA